MSLEKALRALMNLGLDLMDSQVYVFLAKRGPHEEATLAYALNANDRQLCQSLRNLQEKGFITSKTENETIFIAVPLAKVLDVFMKAKIEQAESLQANKDELLSSWRSMTKKEPKHFNNETKKTTCNNQHNQPAT